MVSAKQAAKCLRCNSIPNCDAFCERYDCQYYKAAKLTKEERERFHVPDDYEFGVIDVGKVLLDAADLLDQMEGFVETQRYLINGLKKLCEEISKNESNA